MERPKLDRWAPDAKDEVDAILLRWQREGRVKRHNAKRVQETLGRRHRNREAIWQRDNGTCQLCGEAITTDQWDIDHALPRAHGGTDETANLRASHQHCNRSRRHNLDWHR